MAEHAGTSKIVGGKECQDNYIHAANLGHCIYSSYVQLNEELFISYRVATNLENLENLENSGNLTNYENLRKTQGNLNVCGKKTWKTKGK